MALEEKGIACAVYYPVPLHLQHAFTYLGYQLGDLPLAEEACEKALAIPCYPELTKDEQELIVTAVISGLK